MLELFLLLSPVIILFAVARWCASHKKEQRELELLRLEREKADRERELLEIARRQK